MFVFTLCQNYRASKYLLFLTVFISLKRLHPIYKNSGFMMFFTFLLMTSCFSLKNFAVITNRSITTCR